MIDSRYYRSSLKRCSRTLPGRHDKTEKDRALWFFSTGPQRTNLNLQTVLKSIECLVLKISGFTNKGWWPKPPKPNKGKDTLSLLFKQIFIRSYNSHSSRGSIALWYPSSILVLVVGPTVLEQWKINQIKNQTELDVVKIENKLEKNPSVLFII